MSFSNFPWENNIKPDFVNAEGFEWYLDKETNDWLRKDMANGTKGIKDMACFFVKKGEDITRVLINSKQKIIYDHKNWEAMLSFIDVLKASGNYKD